ncbi:MAG: DUF423 domain-containing protein [Bacteriovoracaceae bacterium]|nr:DUF423 domain-containing protein [Bacteroidota bacterium]
MTKPIMKKIFLLLGSLFAFFGVALGAFGAHGLKQFLPPESLVTFETAVRYQMYHAFAILIVALLADQYPRMAVAGRLFGIGILLFSGSLYVMSTTGIRSFGFITPIGGFCFLAGWWIFFFTALKIKKEN